MPLWLMDIDAAHCSIDSLKTEMAVFQQVQSQHLADVFSKDDHVAIQRITHRSNEVSRCIRTAEAAIAKLAYAGSDAGEEERHVRLNASRAVAKDFEELTQLFRQKQNSYVQELSKRRSISEENEASTTQNASWTLDEPYQQQQQQQQRLIAHRTSTREREIEQMLETMHEVERLFDETRSVTIQQGSMVDRIDFNVEATLDNTDRGKLVLHKIEDRQRHGIVKQVSVILAAVNVFLVRFFSGFFSLLSAIVRVGSDQMVAPLKNSSPNSKLRLKLENEVLSRGRKSRVPKRAKRQLRIFHFETDSLL
eukprot:Gregarina_sp_Poly_1__5949@NODE_3133_length_1350_cov_37_491816_g1991_i0_p1_GENE_NODE_3133_length_1350_cov_37_491816_g1991_i0NODE_3133_length_1350_cov_37_491816_g1991_i0_p1_ORF_typecomplete_len308_score54_45Syntaxin/PF00804_25/2_4e07Syntaxin/PF00804_25/2_4e03SNARE/PF05739_19/2_9e06Clathrin_lg_ch/PF01086_17/0_12VIT1/PF01988_19/0_42FeoC/PF09012_10/9_1e02FeoC/PF09012_10/0_53WASH7_C/PF14746_6/2_9FUSC/PF04632_12/3_3_NODE_3133_length_1350_cov_37_491816_g1991_i02241147